MAKIADNILELAKRVGASGFTTPELRASWQAPAGTITGRTCELLKKGELYAEPGRRRNKAQVYVYKGVSEAPKVQAPVAAAHFELIVDRSGSMAGIKWIKAIQLLRAKLKALAAETPNSTARVSAFDGSHDIGEVASCALDFEAPMFTGGSTSLYDAIAMGIIRCARQERSVVFVLTDGIDEYSTRYTIGSIKSLLMDQDNVSLVLLVPPGQRLYLMNKGFEGGNILEWDAKNIDQVAKQSAAAAVSYSRSGTRQTKNYFKADLSKVTPLDLERDLTEVTAQARRWQVQKETTIEALISEKTKAAYVPGEGFFEVMKREGNIKGDRKFLLLNPQSGRVFADGKKTVREFCGYPKGDIAIKPGNHAGYVLLCQSKSSSKDTFRARILPRGTNVVHWAGR